MNNIPEAPFQSDGNRPLLFDEYDSVRASRKAETELPDANLFFKDWQSVRQNGRIYKINNLARKYLEEISDRSQISPFEYINEDLQLGPPFLLPESEQDNYSFFVEYDKRSETGESERYGVFFRIDRIEKSNPQAEAKAQLILNDYSSKLPAPKDNPWMDAMHGAFITGDFEVSGALWRMHQPSITHQVKAYPFLKLGNDQSRQIQAAFLVWHFALSNVHPEPDIFAYPADLNRPRRWFEEVEKGSRINCLTPCVLAWQTISQSEEQIVIKPARSSGFGGGGGSSELRESTYIEVEHADWRNFSADVWAEEITARISN